MLLPGRVGCDVSKKFGGRNWGGAGANHQKLPRPVSPSSSTMSPNRPSLRPSSGAPVLSARRLFTFAPGRKPAMMGPGTVTPLLDRSPRGTPPGGP